MLTDIIYDQDFYSDVEIKEKIRTIIKNGTDVNAKDKNGYTALMKAVRSGRTEIVKVLIENGVDVNVKDNEGILPLYISCLKKFKKITKLLIEHGANVDAKTYNMERTALMWPSILGRTGHTNKTDRLNIEKYIFNENSVLNKIQVQELHERDKDLEPLYVINPYKKNKLYEYIPKEPEDREEVEASLKALLEGDYKGKWWFWEVYRVWETLEECCWVIEVDLDVQSILKNLISFPYKLYTF